MKTKYYVIMQGEYSDKGVVGITTDLELAKAYCKVKNAGAYGWDGYWIYDEDGTEFITDKSFCERAKKVVEKIVYYAQAEIKGGAKRWSIGNKWDATEETDDMTTKFVIGENDESFAKIHIYTSDENVAEKIAYDLIAKKNAEECGL